MAGAETPAADRSRGGPGSSRQDATDPRRPDEPGTGHAGAKPGRPTNPPTSTVSGGGGERDRRHSHDPRSKS